MRIAVAVAVLAAAGVAALAAGASSGELSARVSPTPDALQTRSWAATITLTDGGRPATARLALTVRKAGERRVFRPRAVRPGSYRVRVVFPSDGRWTWTLTTTAQTLARGAIAVRAGETFVLPYDLAVAPGGSIFFLDRSRVLVYSPRTRAVRVHARTSSTELVAMMRLRDGTLFVTDFPGDRILRIDASGNERVVARVRAPADLVADASGTTLWVASIAEGVGVVRVDVASGRVEPFARPVGPHGIDRHPNGDFVVHDGRTVARIDGETGTLSRLADVDAFKLVIAPDGNVYGSTGQPTGGRVVRIAPDGRVTPVAGSGRLAPHRDGPALEAGILPAGIAVARDGSLLVAQVRPIPAIRRVDLRTERISTVVRGRQ